MTKHLTKHLYLQDVYFNMNNKILGRAIYIRKKIVYLTISILFFASFSGATAFRKNSKELSYIQSDNQNYTHTVFAGIAASQSCGPCHNWSNNMYNTYQSGLYDFEYATMICYDEEGLPLNYDAIYWANNYSTSRFPTTYFDGNFERIKGDYIEKLPDVLDSCGNRTVANITANITVVLVEEATINISIIIENNEGTQYNGYIRVFITEIVSRYKAEGDPFYFGFLDFAFEKNISINPEGIYSDYVIWNGYEHEDNHGDDFGDIKANNIQVTLAVYNISSGYVDETVIAHIPNNPPNKPINPYPKDGAINVRADVDLKWECIDPDGDELIYDVYLGNVIPPPLIESNVTEPFYNPGILEFETTYYWYIVADDNRSGSNESLLWNFTTKVNHPPETPSKPYGPIRGDAGEELQFVTSTFDPDKDDIYYWFDWGNGNNSGWIGPFHSNEIVNASYTWLEGGDYLIRVKAKDVYGAESNWSQNFSIHIVEPILQIDNFGGGFLRVSADINNIGEGEAKNVEWSIKLTSGLIIIGKETTDTIESIMSGEDEKVISKLIIGLGKTQIVFNANVQYGKSDTKTVDVILFGFIMLVR